MANVLAREAATEVDADRGQRDIDRRRVQPRDERAHDRRDERESLAAIRHYGVGLARQGIG
jgi:hypothetical protein